MIVLNTSYLELAKKKFPNMKEEDILKSCPYRLKLMHSSCSTFSDVCDDCWKHGVSKYDLDSFKLD